MPIVLIDTMSDQACFACDDPAALGGPLCTSCRRWSAEGVLPTSIASCRAALDVLADGVGTTDCDIALQRLSNQLTALEAARGDALAG